MNSIPDAMNDSKYWAPKINTDDLKKEIPSAYQTNADGSQTKLRVWDSWPVQDINGAAADYHGYHLAVGLVADAAGTEHWYDAKMGLFAQKLTDNTDDIASW
ncbi:levansucrase [Fructobacillus fructosus]|nr:levansucrase [Fructobacillus fructosus KCTC 3544]GAP01463.1 levansucrase [Fructobacillus fructosus]